MSTYRYFYIAGDRLCFIDRAGIDEIKRFVIQNVGPGIHPVAVVAIDPPAGLIARPPELRRLQKRGRKAGWPV